MNEDTDKIAIGHHKLAKEADNPFSINFKHNLSWSRRASKIVQQENKTP